jgi:hypothetical protein
MHNSLLCQKMIKHSCIVSLLLMGFPVSAEAPSPAQDFWEYMIDFDDGTGDVIDPLEYDQLSNFKHDSAADIPDKKVDETINNASRDKSDMTLNDINIKPADLKFKTPSSAQTSSSVVKGARL